jgi:hypothetical protein
MAMKKPKSRPKRTLTRREQKKTRGGVVPPKVNALKGPAILAPAEDVAEKFEAYPKTLPSDATASGGGGLYTKKDEE